MIKRAKTGIIRFRKIGVIMTLQITFIGISCFIVMQISSFFEVSSLLKAKDNILYKLNINWSNMKNHITVCINSWEIYQKSKYDRHLPQNEIQFNTYTEQAVAITLMYFRPGKQKLWTQVWKAKVMSVIDVFPRYRQNSQLNLSSISETEFEVHLLVDLFSIPPVEMTIAIVQTNKRNQFSHNS